MESPQLYDSSDYTKKPVPTAVKVKSSSILYHEDEYPQLAELSTQEISLDLHNLIDDQFNEGFIQGIEGLSVDKNSQPRGLGVNNNNNMYTPLHYIPQPVHGAAQFDRSYQDRGPPPGGHHDRSNGSIKEEPQEHHLDHAPLDYPPCARVGGGAGYGAAGGYPGGLTGYPSMTPTTVPGADSLCRSPLKSPSGGKMMPIACKKNMDKGSDEYKRRRERNNIAVRKSREKAKARSRETEERVKKLMVDNDRLAKKCELLSKEVAVFHSMFANVHCLPDHVQRELRKQMEAFNQQHQHLLNM